MSQKEASKSSVSADPRNADPKIALGQVCIAIAYFANASVDAHQEGLEFSGVAGILDKLNDSACTLGALVQQALPAESEGE